MRGERKVSKFSPEEKKTIQEVLRRVWNAIGSDVVGELGTISRAEVIEVVLDADRPQDYTEGEAEREILRRFDKLSYDEMIEIARSAFPFARYE
jgi:hypothetical protein